MKRMAIKLTLYFEDIQLLLWDYTLDDEYSDTLVNPENEALSYAARTIYAYFMELFEDTPINDDLHNRQLDFLARTLRRQEY